MKAPVVILSFRYEPEGWTSSSMGVSPHEGSLTIAAEASTNEVVSALRSLLVMMGHDIENVDASLSGKE